jgi:hypothetical protein
MASFSSFVSEALVMARPPSPATTVSTGCGRLRTALRTSRETMPPMPTAKHFR